jgi:membrane-bound serine protease (ClpP class)
LQRLVTNPNLAFLLVVGGIFLIYWELITPGRLVPGLAGSALAAIGAYRLWLNEPTRTGTLLITASILAFIAEALWNCRSIAGALGSLLLGAGSTLLFTGPKRMNPGLAIPLSIAFGLTTVWLTSIARTARRKKWEDL